MRNQLILLILSSLIAIPMVGPPQLASADTAAQAGATVQAPQAPGFFHLAVGTMTVTALYDGFVGIDPKIMTGASEATILDILGRGIAKPGGIQTAVTAFLLDDGTDIILIDAGTGNVFGPDLGHLEGNLRKAGYNPGDVSKVLLTDLHPDHASGLRTPGGAMTFPNTEVWVSRTEADYWLGSENTAAVGTSSEALFKLSSMAVAPYRDAGRLKAFEPGVRIGSNIESIPTPGHTPGHTAFLVSSGDESILIWGDIVHFHQTQFEQPGIALEFDVDQRQAVETRRAMLARAAATRSWVAGAHLPFPGIGHVRLEERGYAWVPVEYGPLDQR